MPGQPVPLAFPLGGISEYPAYAGDPTRSTVRPDHLLNVRPHDSLEDRLRGGKRPGHNKYFAAQPNGTNDIQNINTQIEAVALQEDAGFDTKYANPGSAFPDPVHGIAFHPDGDRVVVFCRASGTAYELATYNWNEATGFGSQIQNLAVATVSGTRGRFRFNAAGTALLVTTESTTNTHNKVFPFSKVTGCGAAVNFPALAGITYADWHPDGDIVFISHVVATLLTVSAYTWTGAALTFRHAVTGTNTSGGPYVAAAPDGSGIGLTDPTFFTTFAYNRTTGFSNEQFAVAGGAGGFFPEINSDSTHFLYISGSDDVAVRTWSAASGMGAATTQANTYGAGNCTQATWSPNGEYIATSGTTTPFVKVFPWTGAFGTVLPNPVTLPTGAGNGAGWGNAGRVLGIGHNTAPLGSFYGFHAATTNPSARRARIVVVGGGNVYRSSIDGDVLLLVNNGSAALISSGPVRSVQAFGGLSLGDMFFCDSTADGYVYLDPSDNTIKDWQTEVTSVSSSVLPVGSADATKACRFITLYRGRVVLAGLLEDPQNIFASAVGNPFDWDYSPTTPTDTQAFALNSSNAGSVGDVVTALMTHSDDLMFIGGDHTLWVMRGDPAAGGTIDKISDQAGVLGPDAFSFDPAGNLYFMGNNGLYLMPAGGGYPQLISAKKLDKTFGNINLRQYTVKLQYDRQARGVNIYILPIIDPAAPVIHYFFDERTGGLCRDDLPYSIGPSAVHLFDADDPDDRAVLLGGTDGYVRFIDPTSADDDGAAIHSFVRFPLLHPSLPMGQFQLNDLQLTLASAAAGGSGVTLNLYRGNTPEEAARSSTVVLTRAQVAGRNLPIRYPVRANALSFELSHSTAGQRWAYEAGVVLIKGMGRIRSAL